MSMFKKLKGIFIEESESTAGSGSQAKSSANPAPSNETVTGPPKPLDKTPGRPSDRFVDMLFRAIEENNLEGFDYLEFKQSLQSLSKIEVDEAKRFQNAFAMASTMGLTKQKLFDSAQHYVNVLGKEEKKFAQAFVKQRDAQIKDREQKGVHLQRSIKSKEEQIKKLQEEIKKEKAQLSSVENDINEAMAKVEATKDGFYGSYNLVLDQIKADIEKMNSFLS